MLWPSPFPCATLAWLTATDNMASGTLQSAGIARRATWAARLVVLAAFFDLFVQFPTIAPHAEQLGASAALVGFIVAAYSFTNLFGNLGAGFILDRWERRTPLVLGMAITILAVLSYSVVQTPAQMIAARAVHGIGAAVLAPGAFSIIGDRAASGGWGRAMGLTGALIAVAALVGPPVAGILRDAWSADAVFIVDAALLLTTLVVFLLITRDASMTAPASRAAQNPAATERTWRNPGLWSAYGAAFAITVGIGALVTHLPLLLQDQGETAARTGYTFAIYALVAMVVMASPISRSGDRFGRFGPLILGLLAIAAGLAVLGVPLPAMRPLPLAWPSSASATAWSSRPLPPWSSGRPAQTGAGWPSASSTPCTRSEWSWARPAADGWRSSKSTWRASPSSPRRP